MQQFQDILEAIKGGGWAVVSGVAFVAVVIILALVFAPLIYISILKGGPAHDRLMDLLRTLLRRPKPKRS